MSIKYNAPLKNILFSQGIPVDRTIYDPALYTGSLLIDDTDGIVLYYSNGVDWVSLTKQSDFAENANVAQFAFSATLATSSEFAEVAEAATTAEFANLAGVASEAETANTALTALTANNSNFLQNRTWQAPAAIGVSVANSAVFTDVLVTSNLAVQNTLTYIDVNNLALQNNFIILNNSQEAPLADIGLVFQRYLNSSEANSNILVSWRENTDEFVIGTTANTLPGVTVNLTDEWLKISNAGVVTVPAGIVTSVLTVNSISANGSFGDDTQALFSNGSEVYWGDIASTVIINDNTSNSEFFVTFTNANSGILDAAYVSDLKLKYIPASGTILSPQGRFNLVDANNVIVKQTLTISSLSANGSIGSNGQYLASNGTVAFWAPIEGGSGSLTVTANNTANAVYFFPMAPIPNGAWSVGVISDNSLSFIPGQGRLQANVISTRSISANTATVVTLVANGTVGNVGQILTSNGTGIYWADSSGLDTQVFVTDNNSTATPHFFATTPVTNGVVDEFVVSNNTIRYIPSSGTLLATNIQVANLAITTLRANNSIGTAGQVLASDGNGNTYWTNSVAGSVGFTGSRGIQGDIGFSGSRGFDGSRGLTGSQGFTGSQGPQGFTGSRGADGTSIRVIGSVATAAALPPSGNTVGDTYVTEDTGNLWTWNGTAWVDVGKFVGLTGSIGFTGSTGFTGSRGVDGTSGATGFTGSRGFTGSQGPLGGEGFTGSRGLTGSIGFTGSAGTAGATGFTGSQGIQGIQGIQGPVGPNGFTGSIGFTGSRGLTGSNGFDGSRGFTGSIGLTGSQGIQGIQGFVGSQGIQGVSGFTGSTGASGGTGFTGSQGTSGTAGFTGSQGSGFIGSRGFTGSSGASGDSGPQGFTGSQGSTGFTGSGGFTTGSNAQVNSLGVGTGPSGTAGEIRATNNITAYFSDDRLKTRLGNIENPLELLKTLDGFFYEPNQTAQDLGYECKREVGVSAQQVQAILPEVVAPAPIDDKYLTVRYEKLIPLLIEAIKELEAKVRELENR